MITDGIGLYVHIPFCVSKCKYCDFTSFGGTCESERDGYVDRLVEEILSWRREERISVKTVFFGGGTPSLLSPHQLGRVCAAIRQTFALADNPEFTVEVNPKTLSAEKVESFVRCGVNRISIGLQSIHENELKALGRIHNYKDFVTTLALAREGGITNVSVDLMYGIPHQSKESFAKTLDAVISHAPTHISAYGLIVEEGTPFYEMRDSLPLPTEDEESAMYSLAADKLRAAGYSHYEISNYAREGYECRHNLVYWHAEEYIGVGLAAHSFFEGCRFSNTEVMADYMSAPDFARSGCERVCGDDAAFEYAMTNLRLSEGLSLSEYEKRFGRSFTAGKDVIDEYVAHGFMYRSSDRLGFTERGFYVSNSILASIL